MLEVGNGLTYTQDKTHFSLWCMLAAPLMAGNDLRKMPEQTTSILTNKEAIAIDQDPLGVECFKYYSFDGLEIFVKPLANNELAVCFLNRSNRPQMINYDWKEHAIADDFSKTNVDFNQSTYKLHDIWTKKDIGTTGKIFKQTIAPDDVIVLRLSK
jgi:alpha-galactosidase